MEYGNKGKELLIDLKSSEFLPAYNEDLVRATVQECNLHFDEITKMTDAVKPDSDSDDDSSSSTTQKKTAALDVPMECRPFLKLHQAALERNKRCLLAYHSYRLDKLREMRCETANAVLTPDIRATFGEAEIDFYSEYDRLVSNYGMQYGVNLTADLSPPDAEEHYVQVRVVQEGLGKIVTESGSSLVLELGSTHFVRRADVEHLVVQGMLEQLDGWFKCYLYDVHFCIRLYVVIVEIYKGLSRKY